MEIYLSLIKYSSANLSKTIIIGNLKIAWRISGVISENIMRVVEIICCFGSKYLLSLHNLILIGRKLKNNLKRDDVRRPPKEATLHIVSRNKHFRGFAYILTFLTNM